MHRPSGAMAGITWQTTKTLSLVSFFTVNWDQEVAYINELSGLTIIMNDYNWRQKC